MDEFESDVEILELAISREEEANKLFLALAERVKNPEMRKVFEELAAEELEHKEKLELEIMKTGRVVTATERLELDNEADTVAALRMLDMDYKDMLLMGMQKEEISFRLYVELAGRVSDRNAHDMLLALAEEEVKHKIRFEIEYENLIRAD